MEEQPIDVLRLLYERQTFQVLSAVFNGVMLWDLIICVPAEIRHIFLPEIVALCSRSGKGRLAVPSILLLISRLLVIPMTALVFSLTLGQPADCMAVYRCLLVLYATSNANACAVFIIRTIAIRSSKCPLRLLLWSLWIIQSSLWFYWSTLLTIDQVPRQDSYESTCQNLGPIPDWTWIIYLSVAFTDVLILILTLQMHIKSFIDVKDLLKSFITFDNTTRNDLAQVFYQDTVMHFVISVTVTLVLSAWFSHHRKDPFYAILIAPIHVWLNLSISPRVIRSLKLHSAKSSCLSTSDRSQVTSPGAITSLEARRYTRDYPNQPGIAFETSKVRRVSAADVFYPPSSPQLNQTSPFHCQFSPLTDRYQRPDLDHPFSQV